jgi:multidrug resistance efflux pump
MSDRLKFFQPAFRATVRAVLTVAIVAVAAVLVLDLWKIYMRAPWTRDGRVRVHVAAIAPEVSGTVVSVPVLDNQYVHKGDLLYQIDPRRYRYELAQAEARVAGAREDMRLRMSDAERRRGLGGIVSAEEQERFNSTAQTAQAELDSALAARDVAAYNLDHTTLRAPFDGWVTNLLLRVGDYASAGSPRISLIDAHSFWIYAYFEETKLHGVRVGDPARIVLMGYRPVLTGHVESIARGINDQNGLSDRLGLQDVNPVFTWVRLAQRIPVHVAIDRVPDGIVLAAGMTCSVAVGAEAADDHHPHGRLLTWLEDNL